MVTGGGWLIAKAATVSLRYCTVRRQGAIGPDGLEQPVLLYPSTYYRLLPILSRAYMFIQLGKGLVSLPSLVRFSPLIPLLDQGI